MTHTIKHDFDELSPTLLPGLSVHIIYRCESEIEYNDDGLEESNRLISLSASVNGQAVPDALLVFPKPEQSHGHRQAQDTRIFLSKARESAQQALWAEAGREGQKQSSDPLAAYRAAERYLQTGSAKLKTT